MKSFWSVLFCSLALSQGALAASPGNFHQVDARLYRGAAVMNQAEADWLQRMGIRTVIKLNDEIPAEDEWGYSLENFHINPFGLNLSYSKVKRVLAAIGKAEATGKVYVHCWRGADRTGLIVALYRVAHGWTKEAAWNEMYDPQYGHDPREVWIDNRFLVYADLLGKEKSSALFGGFHQVADFAE